MAASGVEKKENPTGGFEIQEIKNDGFLYFPNIKNLGRKTSVTFCVSLIRDGKIEIRTNDILGTLLGSVKIKNTESLPTYKNIRCKLENTNGVKNIYLKFKGTGNDLFHLDWFTFKVCR